MPGSLTKDLPYWDIYRDVMVLGDGRLVPVLKLDLPSSDLKSSHDLTRSNDLLAQMLRYGVQENEVLSLAIHTRRNSLDITKAYGAQCTTQDEIAGVITEDRINHFQTLHASSQLFQHELYLSSFAKGKRPGQKQGFVRKRIDKFLGRKSHYQSLSRAEIVRKRTRAVKAREVLSRHMSQAGFKPHVPTTQDIFEAAYRYFNPGIAAPPYQPLDGQAFYPSSVLQQFPELSPNTLRRQLTGSDLDNNPYDHLWLSGHYLVGLTLEKLPDDYTYPDMVQRLLTLPCEKWLMLTMEHVPFAKQLDAFKWKARLLRGFSSASGDDVDPTNESGFGSYRQAIEHMTVGNSHVYRVGLTLFIYAKTLEEAEHQLELAQILAGDMQGAKFMRERSGLSKRFRTLAPFGGGVNDIADLMFQENTADFFPLSGPYQGNTMNPDVLYHTRYDTPLGLTVFDKSCSNWNGVIVGAARSGKSFNANDLLAGVLRQRGVDAVIIDKGGSFREVVKLYGGAYIEVEKTSINPFDLPRGMSYPDEKQLGLLTNLYRAMLKHPLEAEEEALLKAATKQLYRRQTEDDGSSQRFRGALLSDLIKILPTMQQVGSRPITEEQRSLAQALALRLSNWTGSDLKGNFVNQPTSVNLNSRVICFETAGIEDADLYDVALMLINHLIWKRLKTQRGRNMLILEDEFAVQLKNPYSTAVADEISRTAPKYGAAFWMISQSLKDFDNDEAQALLTNTTFHILYPTPSEEKLIQTLFELPDHTMNHYRTLGGHIGEYREALLVIRKESGVKEGGVMVVRPTPRSYWAYTTHNREVVLKEETIAAFQGDVVAALNHLAHKYPKGLMS
jgi:conjugal transfer ATP-binding protein TraC